MSFKLCQQRDSQEKVPLTSLQSAKELIETLYKLSKLTHTQQRMHSVED